MVPMVVIKMFKVRHVIYFCSVRGPFLAHRKVQVFSSFFIKNKSHHGFRFHVSSKVCIEIEGEVKSQKSLSQVRGKKFTLVYQK